VRCVPCNVGNRSKTSIGAVAYVGDAFEEEIDSIGEQAAALGKKGIPIFMFQEGTDGQKAGIVSANGRNSSEGSGHADDPLLREAESQ
jgi:hypothetical protein